MIRGRTRRKKKEKKKKKTRCKRDDHRDGLDESLYLLLLRNNYAFLSG
jgi:hypothetical protein